MESEWTGFLRGAGTPGHAVQVYRDAEEVAESVGRYLAVGFDLREPALLVATPEHVEAVMAVLSESGWPKTRIDHRGLLFLADAQQTLAAIMAGDSPSHAAFESVIGGRLDEIAARFPGCHTRVFGEMVDLLSRDGNVDAAVRLEQLWNKAARRRRFSLLCAYNLDVFDQEAQLDVLPEICRAHSHVLAAANPSRLEEAVDSALTETLGGQAERVWAVVREQPRRRHVPLAQLALMWVSSQLPRSAETILTSAREHYLREPA
jgi:hypothetical protein